MAESQVFYKDGSAVPPERAAEAVAAGQAFARKNQSVSMLDDTGTPVSVDARDIQQAVHAGFQFEDPAAAAQRAKMRERGAIGQQAIAAVEGAGRGATLGLSDLAAGALLGDEYSQAARERQQANPLTAGATEIAGTIAPALLTGGAGAVARGAALTPAALASRAGVAAERLAARATAGLGEGALARMAGRAAQVGASGATEGALYGVGSEISKAALENTDITAEKLLSGALEGGKFGGLTGAGMGAVGSLAGRAAEKLLGGESLRAKARELADESLLKAFGAQASDFKKLTGRKVGQAADDKISQVAKEAFEYRYQSGPLKGQKLFSGAKRADDLIDSVAYAKNEVGEGLGSIYSKADEAIKARPDLGVDVGAYLRRVEEEVLQPLRSSNVPAIRKRADKVERQLEGLRQRLEPVEVKLPDGTIELHPPEPIGFAELNQTRRDIREIFQPPKASGGGLPAAVPEHAAHLEKAERMLSEELDGAVEKALTSVGEDASKFKELKRQYSAFSDLEAVANSAAKRQLGNRAISPSDYGTGLSMAMSMLASGNVAGLAAGAATSFAHKLIRERGRSVLAQMADHVASLDDEAIAGIRKLAGEAGRVPRRAIQSAESIDRRYAEVTDSVKNFQTDPKHAQQVLSSNVDAIAGDHPELAAAIQAKIQGDYQYLAQQIPGQLSRADSSLTPLAATKNARIPHAAKAKLVNIATALERPNSILADLASGSVPREKIEALKARRPEIFNEMRGLVMRHVATKKTEIAYLDRVQLSLAFDFNGDKSLKAIGSIQADNSTPPPEKGNNPPGGASSLNPQKAQEAASLPSQRAEA